MKVLIIYGSRATGKTTLEMNLRRATFGNWRTLDEFQSASVPGAAHGERNICFVGRSMTGKPGRMRPLLLPGADSLPFAGWDGLPNAGIYVVHATADWATRGGKNIAALALIADEVQVIAVYSARRRENLEARWNAFDRKHANADLEAQTKPPKVPEFNANMRVQAYDTGDLGQFINAYHRGCEIIFGWYPWNIAAGNFDVDIVNKEAERCRHRK